MKYTVSKEADKKIGSDMKFIVGELRKRIPEVISIILTGGFSRGEGPIKKIKGKFYPYNDYDIQVISKKKLDKVEVDKIASDISKELGYGGINWIFYPFKKENQKMMDNFYLDLKCDTPEDLKKLLPRIRSYELRNESRILWGEDLRSLIPGFDLNEVPLSDSAKLLLDRMSQMIEYYSIEKKHDLEFVNYVIQQAYAACSTSLLSLSGKYKVGYTRAMKILKENYKKDFPELYKKVPDLANKIEEFINWKKDPKRLPNKNVEEEWFIARRNILEVSKFFFSKFLKRKISNDEELAKAILNMEKEFYSPYIRIILKNKTGVDFGSFSRIFVPGVGFILKKKYSKRLKEMRIKDKTSLFGKSPDLIIFSSLIYLFSSISEGNKIDDKKLLKGKKILEEVYPVEGRNWEEASIDYANAYIAFFMQKL